MVVPPGVPRLAVDALLRSRAEAAVAEFREAIRLDRNYLDSYLNLGMLLGNLTQFDEALKYLKSAADLAPGSARVFQILGQTYLSAGMKQQSDEAFARARELERPGRTRQLKKCKPPRD